MLHRRLEEVALNAWPALQQMLFDGWVLRFAKGYTKRANSVNPVFASSLDIDAKIDTCTRLYGDQGLPLIFRLTPFASPSNLDQVLVQRGYRHLDQTIVQSLDLQEYDLPEARSEELRHLALDGWLDLFCRLSASPLEQHQTHKEILQTIPSRRLLAALVDDGEVVACGLGVLEYTYFGLFDLVTEPTRRNQGYGARLVTQMLKWARQNGATQAYLQVVRSNAPARHLYTKLGFQVAYQYWYRLA